jgi:hypothetical protein
MRRQPIVFRAFFALAVAWLAANATPRATPPAGERAVGIVHGEMVALASPHAVIRGVALSRRTTPADGPARAFLPSRGTSVSPDVATAPSAFQHSGIRERASRTITYDATAPPATPNTVR